MSANSDHAELVRRAERWLEKTCHCSVVIRDDMRAITVSGEIPDAIGWRNGISILVECKTSRADFLADAQKPFRRVPEMGVGDWRFYLCPPGVIHEVDLPDGWGLLWAGARQVRKMAGLPKGNTGWLPVAFKANKRDEARILTSALRRLKVRGLMGAIYDPIRSSSRPEAPQT